jgi:hypothetical protein
VWEKRGGGGAAGAVAQLLAKTYHAPGPASGGPASDVAIATAVAVSPAGVAPDVTAIRVAVAHTG